MTPDHTTEQGACHTSSCPRLSYALTSCDCGFTARMLADPRIVRGGERGRRDVERDARKNV